MVLNIYTLLGTSPKVISLSEMTALLAKISYSTQSTCVKGVDTEVASTKNTYTVSFFTRATSIRGVKCASIRSTGIRSID